MKDNLTKIFCVIFLLWAILLPIAPLHASPISDIPNPRRVNGTWVSDVANILSADTEAHLNKRISQLAANNGSEIAVVTVPDTSPASTVKAYATELFNTWGIGKRGFDNGVLFLVAVKETLGDEWLNNTRYRFGASSLLNDLLRQLQKEKTGAYQAPYYFSEASGAY